MVGRTSFPAWNASLVQEKLCLVCFFLPLHRCHAVVSGNTSIRLKVHGLTPCIHLELHVEVIALRRVDEHLEIIVKVWPARAQQANTKSSKSSKQVQTGQRAV